MDAVAGLVKLTQDMVPNRMRPGCTVMMPFVMEDVKSVSWDVDVAPFPPPLPLPPSLLPVASGLKLLVDVQI
jgi:hypothetical protein